MTERYALSLLAALVLAALLSLGLGGPGDGSAPANDDGFTASGLAWNN